MTCANTEIKGVFSQQSFFLQYTSLILIILAVVIGALYKPEQSSKQVVSTGLKAKFQELGLLHFENIFAENSAEINYSELYGLEQFLKEHDVELDATVFTSDSNSKEARGLAIRRAAILFQYFSSAGIPPNALKVFSENRPGEQQVSIRLRKIPWEGGQ